MKNIYLTIVQLLKEKAKITIDELNHTARIVNYTIKQNNNKHTSNPSQFVIDCHMIYSALISLREKLTTYKEDLDEIQKEINDNLDEKLLHNNMHLQCLLQLDCMQKRSYSFSSKLEYLCRSYENLIAHYQTMHTPMPSITRRIKTTNLLLSFNKQLNKSFKFIKNEFFKLDTKKYGCKQFGTKNPNGIFSTWSFTSHEHLKYIDDSKREFVSFGFWFYEKQIFYPIAFHEIAHAAYLEKNNKIKLSLSSHKRMAEILLQSDKNIFAKSLLYTIFQDIVADFCAYSLSGPSYIFALFYTGFIQDIYKNFYKDMVIEKEIEQEAITNEDIRCKNLHENMTLLEWTHNISKENNFISFYVRIKILITLHTKYIKSSQISSFNQQIEGIESILNLIYPEDNIKPKYNTFENILNSFEVQRAHYNYTKNYVLLLLNLMKEEVFKKHKLQKIVVDTIEKTKEKFQSQKKFKTIIKDYIQFSDNDYENFFSPYDLYWYYRFNYVKDNKTSSGGRLLRLYNILKLGIIDENKDIDLNEVIYEQIFFKLKPEAKLMSKDTISQIYKQLPEKTEGYKIYYTFGPYDIAFLSQNTTCEIDKFLEELEELEKSRDEKNTKEGMEFFTERHALFLIDNIEGDNKNNNIPFDLSISINSNNELQDNKYQKFYQNILKKLEDKKGLFYNTKIFTSMGNENFVVYLSGIELQNIDKITSSFIEIDSLKNINSTILLQNFSDIAIDNEINIILLCKLKKDNNYYNNTLNDLQSLGINLQIYKLYGMFDLKIVLINNINISNIKTIIEKISQYTLDIQIELQNKINKPSS